MVQLFYSCDLWPNCNRSRFSLIGLAKLYLRGEHTMSELVRKSVPQEQQEERIETRSAVKRISGFTIVATAVAIGGLSYTARYAVVLLRPCRPDRVHAR